MTNLNIENYWNDIQNLDQTVLVSDYQPLAFIDDYLSYFNLPTLPALNVIPETLTDIDSLEPSFKDLSNDIAFSLRCRIYTRTNLESIDKWAEKLMRFCEVRYPTLKQRSLEKCGSKDAAQLHLLQLACFFMDQALATQDLRFLNIALKLADLNWVLGNKERLNVALKSNNDSSISLFQFRLVLTIEYALNLLQEG